jgi:uncharacterized protein
MLGELTRAEVEALLRSEVVARIGCHSDGRTYVVPITYVYEDGAIIGHSRDGMKIELMRRNPSVCVEVDRIEDLGNWRSVIAWGRYEELSGAAAVAALEKLVARLEPLATGESSAPPHEGGSPHGEAATGLVVYRIEIHEKTGRFERR